MSERFASLALVWRLSVAAMAGAVGALGQAPFDVPVALLLSLTLAFVLWRMEPRRHGLLGWAFGSGYFALTLVWIVEPFQVDAARHGWMAPFALLFLSAGLALFWGAAFWGARQLSSHVVALVLTWAGAEMLRAYVLTGFPWATPAQVTIHGPASVVLSWVGPIGTTAMLMALAAILSAPPRAGAVLSLRLGQAALLAAGALALSLPHARPGAEPSGHVVRLVQPNAAQHLKWQPEMVELFFERQLEFTAAGPVAPNQPPDLVVWPETAIPWPLERAGPALGQISNAARGTPVALGVLRFEGEHVRNALAIVEEAASVTAIYDKHHLVPFGEYVPFESLFERFGLQALAASMGRFSAGPGAVLLDFGPLGKALPLICYEAVFAHGVNGMPERADFLIQVTNDAWFGTYAGPQQHLAQARMRAVEQGLPLLRAANTGISAAIGPTGRVLAELPLGEAGFIDVALPLPQPPTLYSRIGDAPVLVTILLGLALMAVRSVLRATPSPNRSDSD